MDIGKPLEIIEIRPEDMDELDEAQILPDEEEVPVEQEEAEEVGVS